MDEIMLTEPAAHHAGEVWALREEILSAGDEDAFAGCAGLEACETYEKWLDRLRVWSDPATVPEGRVSATVYIAVRQADGRVVGVIDLRHHIDHPVLSVWGGHIGYSVRPSERGKGYATQMLRQCVKKARERGIERVLVTCHPWNAPSERTIQACGGAFENDVTVDGKAIRRYWIET